MHRIAMSAKSQARRPPFQNIQSEHLSLSSLGASEKILPQKSVLAGNASKLTAHHLNRPLPPIPPVSRKASSVYSLEKEDILDYYADGYSEDDVSRSYDIAPLTEPCTLENLYSERGTSSESTALIDQLSPILSDPAAEPIDTLSWIPSKLRLQYTLDHYGQLTLPSFRSGSSGAGLVAQSSDIAFDTVLAKYSDRSVSPKSQPRQRGSSLKIWSPLAGQYRSTQLQYSASSSVSSRTRPVSPKSIPRSSRVVQSSQAQQEKPPLPSQEHIFHSVSPSSSTQSDRLVLTCPTEQQSSTPPPMSSNNRITPPSSWAYLHNRFSDMYDTLTTLTISPVQRATSVSKELISPTVAHFGNRPKNLSSNPLNLSLNSRPKLKRPMSSSCSTSRPILRSPAVPITPYQYMGTKAWEDNDSPKGKSRERPKSEPEKKGTSPLNINRFALLIGKGKKGRKEEERVERWREELKKTIVVLGPGGDERGGGLMGQDARPTAQGTEWI